MMVSREAGTTPPLNGFLQSASAINRSVIPSNPSLPHSWLHDHGSMRSRSSWSPIRDWCWQGWRSPPGPALLRSTRRWQRCWMNSVWSGERASEVCLNPDNFFPVRCVLAFQLLVITSSIPHTLVLSQLCTARHHQRGQHRGSIVQHRSKHTVRGKLCTTP
jgi:hypothetical protein